MSVALRVERCNTSGEVRHPRPQGGERTRTATTGGAAPLIGSTKNTLRSVAGGMLFSPCP